MVVERQTTHRVPGLYAAVTRRGDPLWGEGVGSATLTVPGEPPHDGSQFLIGSITKTFTAVAIMGLRDEGRLSLDDSVEGHVPESTHGGITIRQMLSHVTGMQREAVGDVWDTLTFPDRRELVDGWNQAERILKPHFRWHYSNLVFAMLGEIVARLDGREWIDSIRARILDPLELRGTSLGFSGEAVTGYFVPPFTDVPVEEPVLETAATASAGGLASTARDLAAWGSFLAEPTDEVLSADTVEEMCQPQIMADLEHWQLAWGLGLMLFRAGDRVFVGHEGAMPGHLTGLVVHRPSATTSVTLANASSDISPSGLALDLSGYLLDHEPVDPDPWSPGTEVPAEFDGLLGRWFSEGQALSFTVREGRLEARGESAPSGRPPSVFARIGDDRFRTESGPETGEVLRITRDSSGTPVSMHWATYLVTREPFAFGEWLR
jgi:CubicO group peptidase (beta-lactamase class C family)